MGKVIYAAHRFTGRAKWTSLTAKLAEMLAARDKLCERCLDKRRDCWCGKYVRGVELE